MALKDKLMTLEDFKAVRDVDVASNNKQFTDIKADLTTLADITPIPDNSDLNNYTETGLYSIEYGNYTILNYPPVTFVASYLEVRALTTGYIGQKLTMPGVGKVFTRRRFNNRQWNDWIQITGLEPGLSTDEKNAIITCFENVAWSSQNAKTVLQELKSLWGITKNIDLAFPGNISMLPGRIGRTSSEDNTAIINNASNVQSATLGASVINADTATIKFNNAIYGIKQGSCNKIKCEAVLGNNSGNGVIRGYGFAVCTIVNDVYHIKSLSGTSNNGEVANLPSNPNDDNYIIVKLEGDGLFPYRAVTSCTIKLFEE